MKSFKFNSKQKHLLILKNGSDVLKEIKNFIIINNVSFGTITGIGALSDVSVSVYDLKNKKHIINHFKSPIEGWVYEVLSFTGNISWNFDTQEPEIHIHITFSDNNGNVRGGHLWKCTCAVTFEIVIEPNDGKKIYRKLDNNTNRYLL